MLDANKSLPTSLVADYIVRSAESFFKNEASSSILLLGSSFAAIFYANSSFSPAYHKLLNTNITIGLGAHQITKTSVHWINDGLITFFILEVKTGMAVLPAEVRWSQVLGASMLGGIGFTMSLFISGLSFSLPDMINYSKLGILMGSILSAAAGLFCLGISCTLSMKNKGAIHA